jgi:hypothetical protein
MPDYQSVSEWIALLQAGAVQAAQQLWQRFVDWLVCLAQRKLSLIRHEWEFKVHS